MPGTPQMKKTLAGLLLALPLFGHAQELALNFTALPLVQFAQSTYRTMLKRDFVISPDLLAADKPISVSVRSIKADELPAFVERVLASQGVRSELRNGVYFLSLASGSSASNLGPITLTGPVSSYGDPASYASPHAPAATHSPAAPLPEQQERDVFRPRNRKADFIASVLNGVFPNKPATAAPGVIVFSAPKDEIPKLLKLSEQLDTASSKVKLSATFVEVSTNEASGIGVSLIADVLGARLGIRLGDTSAGSLSLGANKFQAVIDALASDGRFKQVAAPTAVVDDHEKSNLSFGDSVPTIASTTLDRNGNPIQQVQYQQSGVLLNVQPSVLGSGRITVSVDGQVSSFSATTNGVAGSPTLSKRQVQTSVTVDDGELLLIGGLNNNRATENSSGFSFLPKSWAARNGTATNTDLVLILSATVVK